MRFLLVQLWFSLWVTQLWSLLVSQANPQVAKERTDLDSGGYSGPPTLWGLKSIAILIFLLRAKTNKPDLIPLLWSCCKSRNHSSAWCNMWISSVTQTGICVGMAKLICPWCAKLICVAARCRDLSSSEVTLAHASAPLHCRYVKPNNGMARICKYCSNTLLFEPYS